MRLKDRYLHLMKDIEPIAARHNVHIDIIIDQLARGELVELEHALGVNLATKIALDHIREDVNYYIDTCDIEKKNVKELPGVYYAKHIQAGVAKYDDEMILIENDTLKDMMPSMAGIPVYVQHTEVDLETMKEKADGYVSECFYNELDGWFWCKFIAVSDESRVSIRNGFSVSNAYIPERSSQGGVWHNVEYDREISSGRYTHLAIVDNPRYEESCIMDSESYKKYCEELKEKLDELKNSKGQKKSKTGGKVMKFFTWKKEKVTDSDDLSDVSVELENGKTIKVAEMVNVMEEKAKEEKENEEEKTKKEEENKCNEDTEVEVDGKKMTIGELKSAYGKLMAAKQKKNEEDEEKKKDEDKKETEKKNEKHFNDMKKNIENAKDLVPDSNYETRDTKLKRGQERY